MFFAHFDLASFEKLHLTILPAKLKNNHSNWINTSLWKRDAHRKQHSGLWLFNFSEAPMLRGLLLILDRLVCFQRNCWTAPVASAALLFTADFESVCSPAEPVSTQHPSSRCSLWVELNEDAARGVFAAFLQIDVVSAARQKPFTAKYEEASCRSSTVLLQSSSLKLDMLETLFARLIRSSVVRNLP